MLSNRINMIIAQPISVDGATVYLLGVVTVAVIIILLVFMYASFMKDDNKTRETGNQPQQRANQTNDFNNQFYDVMQFLLERNILSYNEYTQLLQKAKPFL